MHIVYLCDQKSPYIAKKLGYWTSKLGATWLQQEPRFGLECYTWPVLLRRKRNTENMSMFEQITVKTWWVDGSGEISIDRCIDLHIIRNGPILSQRYVNEIFGQHLYLMLQSLAIPFFYCMIMLDFKKLDLWKTYLNRKQYREWSVLHALLTQIQSSLFRAMHCRDTNTFLIVCNCKISLHEMWNKIHQSCIHNFTAFNGTKGVQYFRYSRSLTPNYLYSLNNTFFTIYKYTNRYLRASLYVLDSSSKN